MPKQLFFCLEVAGNMVYGVQNLHAMLKWCIVQRIGVRSFENAKSVFEWSKQKEK